MGTDQTVESVGEHAVTPAGVCRRGKPEAKEQVLVSPDIRGAGQRKPQVREETQREKSNHETPRHTAFKNEEK